MNADKTITCRTCAGPGMRVEHADYQLKHKQVVVVEVVVIVLVAATEVVNNERQTPVAR
jgi:hypothetical protein